MTNPCFLPNIKAEEDDTAENTENATEEKNTEDEESERGEGSEEKDVEEGEDEDVRKKLNVLKITGLKESKGKNNLMQFYGYC